MRALVSRGLLLSPLVCGALVFGPVGAATAAVDAGRTASDRTATRSAAVPEPDVGDLFAQFDELEAAIDALLAKEEAAAEALVAKKEAEVEALLADLDLDGLVAGLDLDGLVAGLDPGTATDIDAAASDADVLLTQLDLLDRMDKDDVLAPLLDELTDIAELDAGELDAAEAARHAKALAAANTTVQERLRKLDATAPVTSDRATAAADPVADLLAALQSAVDGLLKALTSLDLGVVLGAVTGLLAPVLGVVTGLLQPVPGLVTGVLGGVAPQLPALPAA